MNDYWHSELNGGTRCGAMADLLLHESRREVVTRFHHKVTCPYCIAALPGGYGWSEEQRAIMKKEAERHAPPSAGPAEPQERSLALVIQDVRLALSQVSDEYIMMTPSAAQTLVDAAAKELHREQPQPYDYIPSNKVTMRVLITDDASKNDGDTSDDLVIEVSPLGRPSVIRSRFCHADDISVRTMVHTAGDLNEHDQGLIAHGERLLADGLENPLLAAMMKSRDYWYHEHARQASKLEHTKGKLREEADRIADIVKERNYVQERYADLREEARQSAKDYHDVARQRDAAQGRNNRTLRNLREIYGMPEASIEALLTLTAGHYSDTLHEAKLLGCEVKDMIPTVENLLRENASLKYTLGEQACDGKVMSDLAIELSARRMIRELSEALSIQHAVPAGVKALNQHWNDLLFLAADLVQKDAKATTDIARWTEGFNKALGLLPYQSLDRCVSEVKQLKAALSTLHTVPHHILYRDCETPQSVRDWIRLIENKRPIGSTVDEICLAVLREKERVRAAQPPKPRPYKRPAPKPVLNTPAIDALDLTKRPEYDETLEQYTNRIGHTVGVTRKTKGSYDGLRRD